MFHRNPFHRDNLESLVDVQNHLILQINNQQIIVAKLQSNFLMDDLENSEKLRFATEILVNLIDSYAMIENLL